jgi:hypothetical protein
MKVDLPKSRWFHLLLLCPLLVLVTTLSGCWKPFLSDTPNLGQALANETKRPSVGDLTVQIGTNYLKIEGVALVTGLDFTGSNPPPGMRRSTLLTEMQTHQVEDPNSLLASENTSVVVVRGFLPPGVRIGDPIDIEVITPSLSETTSLANGWLLRSRLREVKLFGHAVHSSDVMALAKGPVLVQSLFRGNDDDVDRRSGLVLGGGTSRIDRPLGLVVRNEHSSVRTSNKVGVAINKRFFQGGRGSQSGVARPMTDNYIQLTLLPRYKLNVARYLQVINAIVLMESPLEQQQRLGMLSRKLLEPTTAAEASVQLEAIGNPAIATLKTGLVSDDPEVRFYSAEALAYLDESSAAPILATLASKYHAFRWHALAALSAMDHVAALDALSELLDVKSAETRFGAFRALRSRTPDAPLVRGQKMADFFYHVIPTTKSQVVHFSNSRNPDIVVFGTDIQVQPRSFIYAGKEIIVRPIKEGHLQVSRFSPGQADRFTTCTTELGDLLTAIVRVGGGYGETLECLHAANEGGAINARVLVGARPRPGRSYFRDQQLDEESQVEEPETLFQMANPIPDLFNNRLLQGRDPLPAGPDEDADGSSPSVTAEPEENFFSRFKKTLSW